MSAPNNPQVTLTVAAPPASRAERGQRVLDPVGSGTSGPRGPLPRSRPTHLGTRAQRGRFLIPPRFPPAALRPHRPAGSRPPAPAHPRVLPGLCAGTWLGAWLFHSSLVPAPRPSPARQLTSITAGRKAREAPALSRTPCHPHTLYHQATILPVCASVSPL